YNANPSSMKLAIENFAGLPGDKKILMLGAMAEVGAESLAEHQQMINLISRYKWSDVALVGGDFIKLKSAFNTFPDSASAKAWLAKKNIKGYSLLIKGSRSMKMEQVLAD
ncbi:MAG: UDP-N-acetylmuramoylalanyl-D-glutamate--2,6-diaminopimelate ligase, partial [Chitinophagaceae bacterium]